MIDMIVAYLKTNDHIEAIVLSGSRTGILSDTHSDIDLYIYSDEKIALSFRRELANLYAQSAEVGNDFFDDGDEMILKDGTSLDLMYRRMQWAKREIKHVWFEHRGKVGYTTAFIHNIRTSKILFDRHGQFAALRRMVNTPYAADLTRAIIAKNYPLLRSKITASYYEQLEKARERDDGVSLLHRTAALLASYFDIIFAMNRQTHPGEKQLVQWALKTCRTLPVQFEYDIQQVVSNIHSPHHLENVSRLLDHLDELINLCERTTPADRKEVLRQKHSH